MISLSNAFSYNSINNQFKYKKNYVSWIKFTNWCIVSLVEDFDEKATRFICVICKEEFVDDETVSECRTCSVMFHINHLNEWLKTNSTCPVCNSNLKLRGNVKQRKLDIIIDNKIAQDIIIENKIGTNKRDKIILKLFIGIMALGMIGLFLYLLIGMILEPPAKWFQLLGAILALVPFAMSCVTFISLLFDKRKWSMITLTKEKLTLEFNKKPKLVEIPINEISEIEISRLTKRVEPRDNIDTIYQVCLIIKTVLSTYDIGFITYLENEFEAREYCEGLANKLNNFMIKSSIIEKQQKKDSPLKVILIITVFIIIPIVGLVLMFL
ncbi:MAG: hypothetical protein FK734_15950 [Asgard group archaeon]|nr:hypothetical protein [Asgard group archaeon]